MLKKNAVRRFEAFQKDEPQRDDLWSQNGFHQEILKGGESLGVLREATLERVIVTEAGVEREMLEEFPNPSTPLEECGPGCGCGH